ncbi:MAG: DegT/DnrJ/EryC1/StrS family aminotransferase [Rhodospirillaceae bacterium]
MQIAAPHFDDAEIDALRLCLASGWVTQGPMTRKFEDLIARRHQVTHALATTSCTAALHLATLAANLGPGDEVVVPAFTWITSASCVEYVGAKVVFADVDPATFNLDPAAFEAAITPKTRAVVAVHLFGLAASMDEILAIARRHGLLVIEDAACAIGTSYQGQPVGGLGDMGCFSFHPRKVITTGEGGAVTTGSDSLADRIQSLRNHGATGLPPAELEPHGPWTMGTFNRLGFNLRLSDIQASVGVAQFGKLDALLAHRRACALRYSELLADLDELVRPTDGVDCSGHSFQSYVVRLLAGGRTRRNAVMAQLTDVGIQTRPGTHAVHRLGYYRDKYSLLPQKFPAAATCEDTTITLPIFPGMSPDDQTRVVAVIKSGLTG